MRAYYNEIDPYCCQWLRNLMAEGHIPEGVVDDRDIRDVSPEDLREFDQCHFFAGIGGWALALKLAGADGLICWTGSCPCQPFSSAASGKTKRLEDDRHLWPAWKNLISECRPPVILGEQVAASFDWTDEVCDDMEAMGYEIGAAILPAVAVGADHKRERLYFIGDTYRDGEPRCSEHAKAPRVPWGDCFNGTLALEDGLSRNMAQLRAYGNAIVPQVAAEFIGAYLEARS